MSPDRILDKYPVDTLADLERSVALMFLAAIASLSLSAIFSLFFKALFLLCGFSLFSHTSILLSAH